METETARFKPYTRIQYSKMGIDDIKRRLADAEDRITRTDTEEAYMIDAFAIQELEAALQEKLALQ